MKYLTQKELRKVAELLKMYVTQDKNGWVQIWITKPTRNEEKGVWESSGTSISRKSLIAPYSSNWKKSLITPKTNSYMEAWNDDRENS